jgi:hypothetical protein
MFRIPNVANFAPSVRLAFEALKKYVDLLARPTEWRNVTFQNGWTNFGAPYANVQFRRIGDLIHLRGAATGSLNVIAFTLPVGFRPPVTVEEYGISSANHAVVYVASNGEVTPKGSGSSSEFHFNFRFYSAEEHPGFLE